MTRDRHHRTHRRTRASEIGAAAWNACANPDGVADPHPFTRYEFFAACEESGSATARTGWKPAHLVVEHDGRVIALLPTYLKNHSQGEYVFDSAWADALERAGGDYYPKLQASVPFTPVTGNRSAGGGGHRSRGRTRSAARNRRDGRPAAQGLVAAHHLSHRRRMESRRRNAAICSAPISSSTGRIAATRTSISSWPNCRPPNARTCARSAPRCAKPASNSTG